MSHVVITDEHVQRIKDFVNRRHGPTLRKWNGLPYVSHLWEVGDMVTFAWMSPPRDPDSVSLNERLAVAYQHDLVEDTGTTLDEIYEKDGPVVAYGVMMLTDPPAVPGGPSRALRKQLTRERLMLAPGWLQSIKMGDLLSSWPSIRDNDPDFAKVFRKEATALATALVRAHPLLRRMLLESLNGTLVMHPGLV
jgi:hypothetical protein